jgi:hypothetical protein
MKELAAEFGIDRRTVSTHLWRAAVPTHRQGLDHEQAVDVAALYDAGWSSGRLAQRFGVSADTVLKSSAARGCHIRPRRGGGPASKSTSA